MEKIKSKNTGNSPVYWTPSFVLYTCNKEQDKKYKQKGLINMTTPETKKDLTQEFMMNYVIEKGIADLDWFIDLMQKNAIEKISNLTQEKIKGYNNKVVREEFCKRYFPELIKKTKKKTCMEQLLEKRAELLEKRAELLAKENQKITKIA